MNVSRVYNINSSNQLIDLNGDSVNFDVYYKLQTENNTPFYITVASQTMIDSNSNLSLTKVDSGEFVGRKRVAENEFQNYYLIVRADTECKCTIELIKNVLPINRTPPPVPVSSSSSKSSTTLYYGLAIGALCALGYMYRAQISAMFSRVSSSSELTPAPLTTPSIKPSLYPSKLVPSTKAIPPPSSNLVTKIKNLDI